jgi:hypothetical protein
MTDIFNLDMKIMGPGIWHTIHTAAAHAKDEEKMVEFDHLLEIIIKTIRCVDCRKDLQEFINKNPLLPYRTLKSKNGDLVGYYVWTWKLHNFVNKKLGKSEVNLDTSYEYYAGNKVCFSCIYRQIQNLAG